MPRDDKEREWYMKAGFLAPTTGLKGISQRLEELGYKVLDLTSTALALHRYSYNGLYKGASDYATREEAIRDIQHVASYFWISSTHPPHSYTLRRICGTGSVRP